MSEVEAHRKTLTHTFSMPSNDMPSHVSNIAQVQNKRPIVIDKLIELSLRKLSDVPETFWHVQLTHSDVHMCVCCKMKCTMHIWMKVCWPLFLTTGQSAQCTSGWNAFSTFHHMNDCLFACEFMSERQSPDWSRTDLGVCMQKIPKERKLQLLALTEQWLKMQHARMKMQKTREISYNRQEETTLLISQSNTKLTIWSNQQHHDEVLCHTHHCVFCSLDSPTCSNLRSLHWVELSSFTAHTVKTIINASQIGAKF